MNLGMIPDDLMIPHNRPLITFEDRHAVDSVLASNWIAQGSATADLETNFVLNYGGGSACALSSGTAALFLALKSLGCGAADTVVLPTYACSALLNAVYMVGASPVIIDVLPDTFCLDPAELQAHAAGSRFIIAVHTYGASADISALYAPGRRIIEDCCHSIGGEINNTLLGLQGDAAVFSFYATKIITGGQGGLIWSKDISVVEKAKDYRQFDCRESYAPRFNLQMTDIEATLINSQMLRLKAIRERRQEIAKIYLDALPDGLTVQTGLTDVGRMVHRFVVITPDIEIREALQLHLKQSGITSSVPIERYELLHNYLKLDADDYPVAERLVDTTLSLPIFPSLTDQEVNKIATSLREFKI